MVPDTLPLISFKILRNKNAIVKLTKKIKPFTTPILI